MLYHYILKGWVKVCILYVINIKNHKIMSTAENTTRRQTLFRTGSIARHIKPTTWCGHNWDYCPDTVGFERLY